LLPSSFTQAKPSSDLYSVSRTHGKCTVTILNDDKPGILSFDKDHYEVRETDGQVEVKVVRTGGGLGDVTVRYKTVDDSAVAPADYGHVDGLLEFKSGEVEKSFSIKIVEDDQWERDERFQIHLYEPSGGAAFDPETNGKAEKEIVSVTIKSDDKMKTLSDALNHMMGINRDKLKIGSSNWKEQFELAIDPRGGDKVGTGR
jgi:solute carrier family 8 (sodium/calcium exchanger)